MKNIKRLLGIGQGLKKGDNIYYKMDNGLVMTDRIIHACTHPHTKQKAFYAELGRVKTNSQLIKY